MLRIQTSTDRDQVVFQVSGQIEAGDVGELQRLIHFEASNHNFVLDLKDITLVSREAVRFLADCEAGGAKLRNCPAYIREWIVRQNQQA